MQLYQRINNITGWVVFCVALLVYTLTIESSASFWDCGEFVPGAYKLEVVHPPGAPLFLMIGRMFTLLAGSNKEMVPYWVNFMSGLASAFAVLFLFWSCTLLAKKILIKKAEDCTTMEMVSIMGVGVIGAITGMFCDSFWFSAVEAEVYAMSIMFLMMVIWAIFKWDSLEGKYADRWLIFIGFAIGLSLGVHLLSLLALPILGVMYYFKYYRFKWLSFGVAMAISFASVPLIMKFVISGLPELVSSLDYVSVNYLKLPFNTGAVIALVILVGATIGSLALSHVLEAPRLNTLILSVLFIIIGYSSYIMVPLRSQANPPINMNKPKDPYRLLSYLNREQYGDRPLLYGPQYTADQYDIKGITKKGNVIYKGKEKYEKVDEKLDYEWRPGAEVLFPRMGFWQEPEKIEAYRGWMSPTYNVVDRAADNAIVAQEETYEAATNRANALNAQANGQPRYAVKDDINMGTNIAFFTKYQMGFMYLRYLMWNFSGRQNDIQGFYFNDDGRWTTGIDFLDNIFKPLGTPQMPQTNLPSDKQGNWAHNKFFMIPFILGILGAVYTYKKDRNVFFAIFLFWFITGILQIVYLNQPPREPRERDYIFAGSVLAYSIWIGFSVLFIRDLIASRMKEGMAAPAIAIGLAAIAPFLMGSQGWDDHNRNGRYIARDMAIDYLESCAPNAILFTQGDNDTYPLWYAQEVEGIRTDIRIINLSLLGVDWYIDQLKYKMNDAAPVKLSFNWDQIRSRNRDVVRYRPSPILDQNQYYNAKQIMQFVASDRPEDKVPSGNNDGELENYLPTMNLFIPVDSMEIVKRDILSKDDLDEMVSRLEWKLPNGTLLKNDLITLDIIANNLWDRPVYFAVSVAPSAYIGLTKYVQLEGLAYRIVPRLNPTEDINRGPLRTDVMYDRLMNKFKWGNMANSKVYLDENVLRMTFNIRSNYARLANELAAQGQNDKVKKVMDACLKGLPVERVPLTIYHMSFPEAYYRIGDKATGKKYATQLAKLAEEYLNYYKGVNGITGQNDEVQRNMYMMQQMSIMMRTYGDSTDATAWENKLSQFGSAYGIQTR